MKGLSILTDEQNNQILQLNLTQLVKKPALVEDVMDIITATARKNEKKITWETAKKQLKKPRKS